MSKAVFSGTFDPITLGHVDIIRRGAQLFDELYVGILDNPAKSFFFTHEERFRIAQEAVADIPNVRVFLHTGSMVEFLRTHDVYTILRGLRGSTDLEYEKQMAEINQMLEPRCETVSLPARPELASISSSAVKEVASIGESIKRLVPECVIRYWNEKQG